MRTNTEGKNSKKERKPRNKLPCASDEKFMERFYKELKEMGFDPNDHKDKLPEFHISFRNYMRKIMYPENALAKIVAVLMRRHAFLPEEVKLIKDAGFKVKVVPPRLSIPKELQYLVE